MKVDSFDKLKIWHLGKAIATKSYEATKHFPKSETFGLVSQIRRSAVSIPSNIAEGFGRWNKKEFQRFLQISMGSCFELSTQITISYELNFLDKIQKEELLKSISEETKMIRSLITKLNMSIKRK